MLPNPYTPGEAPPRLFVGREAELDRAKNALGRIVAFGEMMGGPLLFSGPRGVGKTSLLQEVRAAAAPAGFVIADLSGAKQAPFLGDLLEAVKEGLDGISLKVPEQRKRRLDELGASVGTSLASVSAKMKWDDGQARAQVSPAVVRPLESFLRMAGSEARKRGSAGLLMLVDELHEPLETRTPARYDPDPKAFLEAAVLLNALQNLNKRREENPLGFVCAGLPQTKSLLSRAATFGERFIREVVLNELSEESSRDLLVLPAEAQDVGWDPEALEEALLIGEKYPEALQTAGYWAWEQARPTQGAVIAAGHVAGARRAITDDLRSMYRVRWDLATGDELAFLKAMAALSDPVVKNGAVKRGDIAAELGRSTQSISAPRDACLSKGLITEAQYGYLRFTVPGFADFIKELDSTQ